jgi:SRSO17 transposase
MVNYTHLVWHNPAWDLIRVRSAHNRDAATATVAEEWLLIEWPPDEEAPTKFWLSTLHANITFAHLVRTAKLRWRIERDYLELKQEIGLGHFEGRGWRGLHHHATLCTFLSRASR